MTLELLHAAPEGRISNKHILFVHGICVGAWVWEPYFLPFFANAGYHAWALSLRGHAGSPGRENLSFASLADYAEDVAWAVRHIGEPVIVVGHSMGGAVVQRWVYEGGNPRGMALLSSVPPWGLAMVAMNMGFCSPGLFGELFKMNQFGVDHADAKVLWKALFSHEFSPTEFESFAAKTHNESRLVSVELQGLTPIAPLFCGSPVYVSSGSNDAFIPVKEVERTAAYYNTRAEILPGLAHCLMLEKEWERAAKPLLAWMQRLP